MFATVLGFGVVFCLALERGGCFTRALWVASQILCTRHGSNTPTIACSLLHNVY